MDTMNIIKQIMDHYGFIVLTSTFIILFILETKFELRKRVQSRFQRIIINGSLAAVSYVVLRFAFIPAMVWLAIQNKDWHFGLSYVLHLPAAVAFIVGFLLLDYFNYLWHIVNHKVPLLWRFHNVHHSDLDLDVTTAMRFHFMEMVGSIIFRGAATVLVGASPALVLIYEIVFEAATAFHHSNLRLPVRFEKVLNFIFVTPRMHGVHHSIIKRETDSNYSVIFSFWDRLHKTLRLNIPQDDIVIGVPAYRHHQELTIWKLLKMPFIKQKDWKLPNGNIPEREIKIERI